MTPPEDNRDAFWGPGPSSTVADEAVRVEREIVMLTRRAEAYEQKVIRLKKVRNRLYSIRAFFSDGVPDSFAGDRTVVREDMRRDVFDDMTTAISLVSHEIRLAVHGAAATDERLDALEGRRADPWMDLPFN